MTDLASIMLGLVAIAALCLAIDIALIVTAPEGYEDADGFHLGPEPSVSRKPGTPPNKCARSTDADLSIRVHANSGSPERQRNHG